MQGKGVPTLYIGPPARYIHSHAGLIDEGDFEQTVQMMVEVTKRLDGDTVAGLTSYDM